MPICTTERNSKVIKDFFAFLLLLFLAHLWKRSFGKKCQKQYPHCLSDSLKRCQTFFHLTENRGSPLLFCNEQRIESEFWRVYLKFEKNLTFGWLFFKVVKTQNKSSFTGFGVYICHRTHDLWVDLQNPKLNCDI